ncbi:ABC-type antimicrobial peptide transport system permease subunit [Frigoribacterium sp. PhB160]|uniref:hypothetical protein n=1 Tax=Frigoribacterium sp. PhB160 TaxID=2485192 RepID=UPI000FADD0ED|nr:hypothetical protein [Frigoribacterium sp. PhB160]ROS60997.1 ABC-type antimicrobial peptide transport system permease subunit [Frigoribacterium sp. PhB160]
MTTIGLLWRRALARRALVSAVALVAALTVPFVAVVLGLVDDGASRGAVEVLRAQPAQAASARVSAPLADDPAAADDAVRALVAERFPADSVDVLSRTRSAPLTVAAGPAGALGSPVVVGTEPALGDLAEVVAGEALDAGGASSSGVVPAAVQADAAEALGLAIGDRLTVGTDDETLELEVTSTWRAADPTATAWWGEPAAAGGATTTSDGLVVVPEGSAGDVPGAATASWVLAATPTGVRGGTASDVAAALSTLPDDLADADLGGSTVPDVDGALGRTLDDLVRARSSALALAAVALSLAGVLAATAVLQVSTLLARSRRDQHDLLRARGATTGQFTFLAVVETGVVALVAGLVGGAVGLGASGGVAGLAATAAALLAVVVGSVVVAGLVGLVDARAQARGRAPGRAGASPVVPLVAAGVVALLGAGLTTARLLQRGTPFRTDDGTAAGTVVGVDPVAALGPVLVLVAGVLVAGLLLVPASAGVARVAARGPRLAPSLPARQVARRPWQAVAVAAAVAAAVATAGLASGFASTWREVDASAAAVRVGAPLTATVSDARSVESGAVPLRSAALAGSDDVTASAAVVVDTATVGDDEVALVGLASDRWAGLLDDPARASSLSDRLAPPSLAGTPLPEGTRRVTASLAVGEPTSSADGSPVFAGGTVSTVLWAADDDGVVVEVPLVGTGAGGAAPDTEAAAGTDAGTGTDTETGPETDANAASASRGSLRLGEDAEVSAELPAARGSWRLLAAQSTMQLTFAPFAEFPGDPEPAPVAVDVAIGSLRVGTADGTDAAAPETATEPVDLSARFLVVEEQAVERVPLGPAAAETDPRDVGPGGTGRGDAALPDVPVVLTSALAARTGAGVGDSVDVLPGTTGDPVPAVVAGVVDALPGSGRSRSAAVDLRALTDHAVLAGDRVPTPGSLWVAPRDGRTAEATVDLVRAVDEEAVVRSAASTTVAPVVRPAVTAAWAAAAAAGVLAVLVAAAASAGQRRQRLEEVAVLRQLGVRPARQAAQRAAESVAVLLAAVVAGVAVGAAVVGTAVAPFALAAVPGSSAIVRSTPGVDPVSWGLAVAALVAALAVVVVVDALVVARSARTATLAEGDR